MKKSTLNIYLRKTDDLPDHQGLNSSSIDPRNGIIILDLKFEQLRFFLYNNNICLYDYEYSTFYAGVKN